MSRAAELRARPLGEASLVTLDEAAAQLRCRAAEVRQVLEAAGVAPVRPGRAPVWLWREVLVAFRGAAEQVDTAPAARQPSSTSRVWTGPRRRVR